MKYSVIKTKHTLHVLFESIGSFKVLLWIFKHFVTLLIELE